MDRTHLREARVGGVAGQYVQRVSSNSPAASALFGGWAHGPCEAWAFAASLSAGSDRDKRMAMLIVDNAVELALKTYLSLNKRLRGGAEVPLSADPRFIDLINGFEQCFPEWPAGLSRAELLWMHDVRNTLHHRGNGLTSDERHLQNYLRATEVLLAFLFGQDAIDEAKSACPAPAEADRSHWLETPPLVAELDDMIARIRRRQAELPPGAATRIAVPMDVLALVERFNDLLFDYAPNWDRDTAEVMQSYSDFMWEEGVPDDADEAVRELENLRVALTMALM